MNKTSLKKIQDWLTAEQTRLSDELTHFQHRNPESESDLLYKNDKDDEEDGATRIAQLSDDLSVEFELEKALRDVESSLKQIENGTYGICKYCHLPIDERRLIARPASSSCIQCKKTLTQEM